MTPLDEKLKTAPPVRGPVNATPQRRSGSVRRTSTIDATWPDGWGTEMCLLGRARDLLTPADGSPPVTLAEQMIRVGVGRDRTITDITAEPENGSLGQLIGARGGGRLRSVLADVVARERAAAAPLYLLLDDLAGATLISGFAYSQWPEEWPTDWAERRGSGTSLRRMEGVCIGFQPGSSALTDDGAPRFVHDVRSVEPLPAEGDPIGWHQLDDITSVSMRRARRIDVTLAGDTVEIDAMFQDSATVPAGGRVAVHEYALAATADLATGSLLRVLADPRVLPYRECPLAAASAQQMVGTPLAAMREEVLARLPGTAGCTHLNDALRALAEVPALARSLREQNPSL
ncbi:MAG TPA: DUF2889 domain-containing protein [Mycobacteriales bacterium]|jgi:hypothetical protein|nr:DUF2889 domain-containing protein [Mycobacteriales bacterium]